MNILKIYPNREVAVSRMQEFTQVNPGAKCHIKDCRVTLFNGSEVYFGYLRSEKDLVKYQGWRYQVLEIQAPLSEECVSWLMSRVRE